MRSLILPSRVLKADTIGPIGLIWRILVLAWVRQVWLGERTLNTRDLDRYLRQALAGEETAFQRERLDPLEVAKETLMMNLRRVEGMVASEFLDRTGLSLDSVFGGGADALVEQGLLARDNQGLRLTREGRFVADAVIVKLLAGAPATVEGAYPEGAA